jgi:hypothetical protein
MENEYISQFCFIIYFCAKCLQKSALFLRVIFVRQKMLFENLWWKEWKKTNEQDTTTKQCVYCTYIHILWEKTKIMLVVGKDSTWIWKMFFPDFEYLQWQMHQLQKEGLQTLHANSSILSLLGLLKN